MHRQDRSTGWPGWVRPCPNPEHESEFRMAAEMSMGTYIHSALNGPVLDIDVGTPRQEFESLSGIKSGFGALGSH